MEPGNHQKKKTNKAKNRLKRDSAKRPTERPVRLIVLR